MTTVTVNKKSRWTISKDRLLVVEGRDEVHLIGTLVKHRFGDDARTRVQILDVGGKEQFSDNLPTVAAHVHKNPSFRVIGIVRDADTNPEGAFRSVCDDVESFGLEPPANHAEYSDGNPSIGVFIVPSGNSNGAIETLCRLSVENDMTSHCVVDYLQCLKEKNAMQSRNEDKSFVHAYLAASRNPVARAGEGALQKVWDFDSKAFEDLSIFIDKLLKV